MDCDLIHDLIHDKKCPPPPPDDCYFDEFRREISEFAEISLPVEIDPSVSVGRIKAECCGDPVVVCRKDECKHTCKLAIIQKICVKIPLTYTVVTCVEEDTVTCCTNPCPE